MGHVIAWKNPSTALTQPPNSSSHDTSANLADTESHSSQKKIQSTQQGHKMSHNVGTRLLPGFLVSFASGVVEWNCWMKQQSEHRNRGHLQLSKLDVWVLCMGHRA